MIDEYDKVKTLYEEFSLRLKTILEEVLNLEKCNFVFVESRCKQSESLKRKLELGKFDTIQSVNDLAGFRVATYVYSDIKKIEELLPNVFDASFVKVDERLGIDKVGYKSHHWIIKLPESRIQLPEYKRFSGLKAELQIRTILQHAWAQIGHNQIYKPSSILPEKIKRDFSLLSGLLEIADNEFSRISKEISTYSNEVNEKTSKGDLDITIDSLSLRSFLLQRFGDIKLIQPEFGPKDDVTERIIQEMNLMGITTLKKLDSIIPKDLSTVMSNLREPTNFAGLARAIMIVYDSKKYFENAWRGSWSAGPGNEDHSEYSHYGINLNKLVSEYESRLHN